MPEFKIEIVAKAPEWFHLPQQVRLDINPGLSPDVLRPLGESMRVRQIQPVGAKPDGTALWGFRRILAARLVSLKSVMTVITAEEMTETQVRLIQLAENIHRADLTGYEKWQACEELLRLNPTWGNKDLAEHLMLDPSMVPRLLSPGKCIATVQEALKSDAIGIKATYELSKLSLEDQATLLAKKLAGASADDVASEGRKRRRNGSTQAAVKVQRLRCPLSSGVMVQFSLAGDGISLDDAIEAAQEAIKTMKKAREEGLDSKTAQAVFRQTSKKG